MSIFPTETNFGPSATARALRHTDDQKPVTKTMQAASTQQTVQDLNKPHVPAVTPAIRVDPSTNIPVLEIYQGSEVVFRTPTDRELRAYRNGEKTEHEQNAEAKPDEPRPEGGPSGFHQIVAKNQVD